MKVDRCFTIVLGGLVIALVLMLPMVSASTPLLQGTLTPTAFVYLPYVVRSGGTSSTPTSTPTPTPTNTPIAAPTSTPVPGSMLWGMFQHDLQHTGQSPFIGPQKSTPLWTFPTDGVPGSPVIGSEGTIYLPVGMLNTDTVGHLYAINPDGTEKWRIQLDILPSSTTPAIGLDGTIYVHGNGDGGNLVAIEKLHAITPAGVITWTFEFNGGKSIFTGKVQSSPSVGLDGTIYVGSMDTNLYALNPDGTIKWARSPSISSIHSSPAVASDGTVYIHDQSGLYAYSSSGTEKWRTEINVSGADGSPSIGSDGTIYLAHAGTDILYAVNPDGTVRWQYTLGFHPESSPAIASDGTIYIGDDGLYGLSPDGTLKWKFPSSGAPIHFSSASPIIGADGTVYWRSSWSFYAINPDGTQKWKLATAPFPGGALDSTAALRSDWTLYVPTARYASSGQNGLSAYQSSP
jgi:outer membrane protein assembly factor BamB